MSLHLERAFPSGKRNTTPYPSLQHTTTAIAVQTLEDLIAMLEAYPIWCEGTMVIGVFILPWQAPFLAERQADLPAARMLLSTLRARLVEENAAKVLAKQLADKQRLTGLLSGAPGTFWMEEVEKHFRLAETTSWSTLDQSASEDGLEAPVINNYQLGLNRAFRAYCSMHK